MHYYQHHIGDFIRDTSRLTDSQTIAYLRLIWLYYETEEPLENDIPMLAFKIGSDENTVEMLLKCYFNANALHWHHKRIDSEIEAYKNKSEKAKKSAESRWKNTNAMRTHNDSNANAMLTSNQEPVTKNQEPVTKDKQNNSLSTDPKPTKIDINFSYNQKHKDLAQELNLAIDLERDKFVDYYLNKTNKKFLDWDAAFRNWLRKAAEFAKTAKTSNRACPPTEQESAQADEYRKQFIQIGEKGGSL